MNSLLKTMVYRRATFALVIAALASCSSNEPPSRSSSPAARSEHARVSNRFPSDSGPVPAVAAQSLVRRPDLRPFAQVAPDAVTPAGTLVLYDDSGAYAWLGELYGIAAANLGSRFGSVTTKPVSRYAIGDVDRHAATIYVGSTYDQPLPADFLEDVALGTRPVIWLYNNIWQLANRLGGDAFVARYGFLPWRYDTTTIAQVDYKGRALGRYAANAGGIMEHNPFDGGRATVLAAAVRADGTTLPWAVRANNLTYVGEIPFAYIGGDDRYLAFCDLLFDALAPLTPERHRALVRIEDVSADTNAGELQAVGDVLAAEGVPFSIALIAVYTDPNNAYGIPGPLQLSDNPALLEVLQDLVAKGATLVAHGNTHQFGNLINPYTGTTADDFEFFRAHVDADNNVIYDGSVEGDSAAWAVARMQDARAAVVAAGLPAPTIFEFPHYAGSAVDSRALRSLYDRVYHRGLYFNGALTGGPEETSPSRMMGQFFPYPVTDVFGWRVIPENLGNYEPEPFNNHPARLVPDLVRTAESNLVVRDGVASFYFHPYFDAAVLRELVQGIRAAGYTFIAPTEL
jgi:uncharacterized protein YdaL